MKNIFFSPNGERDNFSYSTPIYFRRLQHLYCRIFDTRHGGPPKIQTLELRLMWPATDLRMFYLAHREKRLPTLNYEIHSDCFTGFYNQL